MDSKGDNVHINVLTGKKIEEDKKTFIDRLKNGEIDWKIANSHITAWVQHDLNEKDLNAASQNERLKFKKGSYIYKPVWVFSDQNGKNHTSIIPVELSHHFFDPKVIDVFRNKTLDCTPRDEYGLPSIDVRLFYDKQSMAMKSQAQERAQTKERKLPRRSKPKDSSIKSVLTQQRPPENGHSELLEFIPETGGYKPYEGKYAETILRRTFEGNARFPVDKHLFKFFRENYALSASQLENVASQQIPPIVENNDIAENEPQVEQNEIFEPAQEPNEIFEPAQEPQIDQTEKSIPEKTNTKKMKIEELITWIQENSDSIEMHDISDQRGYLILKNL